MSKRPHSERWTTQRETDYTAREGPHSERRTTQRERRTTHTETDHTEIRYSSRGSKQTHLLDVNLNVLLQVIPVQIEHEVVHKVESIADDDEWQLVGELGLLQEVLHTLSVIAVALATYPNESKH